MSFLNASKKSLLKPPSISLSRRLHPLRELFKELRITGNQPRIQHRSLGNQVLLSNVQRILDRPDTVANLESHVPKQTQHLLNHEILCFTLTPFLEEHQVDIRVRRQLLTAVSAQSHDRGSLRDARFHARLL